jgi:hypothetical protein
MQYIVSLSDERRDHLVVFTLREADVKRPAIDFFFDIAGTSAQQLADDNVIAPGQSDDLVTLQKEVFAEDDQGHYVKDDVVITSNGKELNPDAPFRDAFVSAERDGVGYMLCDLLVCKMGAVAPAASTTAGAGAAVGGQTQDQDDEPKQKLVDDFARIWFIWEIATGYLIDVTKDDPDLTESIAEAEKNSWIEIDVQKAAYKLTDEGQKLYRSYKSEAQELIKRYDIYGDVDVDVDGTIRFDTGLGRDLRIPIFELDGIDPFRARFLIGLNDDEFRDEKNWPELYKSEKSYQLIMRDVSYAPALDTYDRNLLTRILHEGKAQLRLDGRLS